uniref:Uncharacterized protein n=1 Tax=Lactarius sp. (in: basidiomycete fungi) TaxID=1886493 RepID=A0A2Z4M906_9AGAM|nr:hypothetical protein [Lactarius sp. (in: basidiomycete fungi)]
MILIEIFCTAIIAAKTNSVFIFSTIKFSRFFSKLVKFLTRVLLWSLVPTDSVHYYIQILLNAFLKFYLSQYFPFNFLFIIFTKHYCLELLRLLNPFFFNWNYQFISLHY